MSAFKMGSARGIYPMGEVSDYSGNGNILTVGGAIVVPGKLSNAYSFTTDDYVETAGLVTSMASDTKGTIAGWVYLDSDTGTSPIMFNLGDSTAATAQELTIYADFVTNDTLHFRTIVENVVQWDFTTPINSLDSKVGGWMSVVGIHNGTILTNIYLDGVDQLLTKATETDNSVWTSDVITAGADLVTFGAWNRNGTRANYFEGDLDEWGFFGDTWDADDVAAFHNGGLGQLITQRVPKKIFGQYGEIIETGIIGSKNPIVR